MRGCRVSLTTNGQLLDIFARNLSQSGLALIRTSWHTTNPLVFKEISGGHGDYDRFLRGIEVALDSGIKLSFNRVLLKDYTDDIPSQLSLIEQYKSRLKLYTLLWTPQSAETHDRFFQKWQPVVRKYVLPRAVEIVRERKKIGRNRLKFPLIGGGSVEIKLGEIDRSSAPCDSCSFREMCEESFGDYARVDPNMNLYFCYMRRDIGFRLPEYFGRPDDLKHKIQESLGGVDIDSFLTTTPLRLTVTPMCNFNCRAPGMKHGWCMEESDDYTHPKILPTILKRE